MSDHLRQRARMRILLALLVVTPTGFGFKYYGGPAHCWFNNYGAGVLYEVFWVLIGAFLFPERRVLLRISISVFVLTTVLEFAQLWHPPSLEAVRSTFLGRTLLGTSFAWLDFPHYLVGSVFGYLIAYAMVKTSQGSD